MQRFTLSLRPHRGTWADADLARAAAELDRRPMLLMESAHPGRLPSAGRYASLTPGNLVFGAMKVAEDGDDLVVRVVETAGRAVRGVVDLQLWQRRFEIDVRPFEIRTFRVSRDPDIDVVETDLLERPLATTGEPAAEAAERAPHADGSYSPL
jgi:alpha-mannosidase